MDACAACTIPVRTLNSKAVMPMSVLVRKDEQQDAWYPVPIEKLDDFLNKVIVNGTPYAHPYALRRNIAYNLQHIEFLHKCLSDLKMSNVLQTQTWKTILLVGCGIMESLLHFLLVKKELHATTEWELSVVLSGNPKNVDRILTKADVHIFTKLEPPVPVQMKFDSILQKAKAKKLLGSASTIYSQLGKLRKLRNKVHLQATDNPTDTDWNSFSKSEVTDIDAILFSVFTSNIFRPSTQEKRYFQYLHDYCTH